MIIAVIGDYRLPEYKTLLQRVKMAKPEETVLDLSRHPKSTFEKELSLRYADIGNAHLVVIGRNYDDFAPRRDITQAQHLHKECLIETIDGQFRPFPEYANKI